MLRTAVRCSSPIRNGRQPLPPERLAAPSRAHRGSRLTSHSANLQTVDDQVDIAVDLQGLLDELCVRLGFCLPPQEQERLRQTRPPLDVDEFTDAVFVAERMDPRLYKASRRRVRDCVEQHLAAITARLHDDPTQCLHSDP